MALIESGKSFDKEDNHEKMKKRMVNMDTSSYLLRVPTNVYKKFKMQLIRDEKNMKEVLISMIEDYIK